MDLNHILLWIVSLSCFSILFWSSRSSLSYNRGWVLVSGFILLAIAVSLVAASSHAGYIGGILWAVLVLLPLIGFKKVNQLVAQERYRPARKLSSRLRWLHPSDGWWEQPELFRALELGQQGNMAEAIEIFNRYKTSKTPIGRTATVLLYRMGARWEELLTWLREQLPESLLFADPTMGSYYLRALGETGDINGLLEGLERFDKILEKSGKSGTLNMMRMFALAFCGQPEQVKNLFYTSLAMYSQNVRQFWLATANMAAGKEAEAKEQLLGLSLSPDITLNNAIGRRFSHPLSRPELILTESSQQILASIPHQIQQEARYVERFAIINKKAYLTFGLIALNSIVFAVAVFSGGSENLANLYRLGALVPQAVWQGEWWRLVTGIFLHFGWLHLLLNMLGLSLLGGFVEVTLGRWRYLFAYFFSGIGSMLVISILATVTGGPSIAVGASGAIMGMLGVIIAILLQGWRQEKARVAGKRLRSFLLIMGLQVVIDLTTPNISFVGHFSGAVLGFLTGLILLRNWQFKN